MAVTYACVIEWPLRAVHLSLGRLNYGEVFFGLFLSLLAFKVVTRKSRFLNFSMATLERANLGGANMRIVRGGHFLAARFNRFSS